MKWLQSVPLGWTVVPLKHAARVFPSNVDKHSHENEIPVRLCNYTDVYYNDRVDGQLAFMEATATPEEIRKFTLRQGDTIITKDSETADDIGRSAYVSEPIPGVLCGYHLSVIRPSHRLEGRFIKRLFDSSYLKAVMEVSANGLTRVGLGQYAIDNLDIPLPPLDEQVGIADFLDRETAKIDALIAKQEQLIATLREDRTATITHAVTKGLDPDVEMTDSGAEMPPEIPATWSCISLKRLLSQPMKYGANEAADDDDPDNPRFVRITDIDPSGDLRSETFRSLPPDVAAPYFLDDGDLLFARSGATVGKTFLYRSSWGTCCFAGYLIRARVNPNLLNPCFLNYYAASEPYWQFISMAQIQATIQNVSAEKYGMLPVPLPPLDIQNQIVEHLDRLCQKVDSLVAKATGVIGILREYRAALITDAVTGKIDVRGAA